jgi:hypothetical protein
MTRTPVDPPTPEPIDPREITDLVGFVVDISKNPKKIDAFRRDPEAFLAGTSLSEVTRRVVLEGRDALIGRVATGLAEAGDTTVVVVVAVAVA